MGWWSVDEAKCLASSGIVITSPSRQHTSSILLENWGRGRGKMQATRVACMVRMKNSSRDVPPLWLVSGTGLGSGQ